ncbi:DUF3231 family protein [Bacillus sp. T33-2]|uniref:DUF3231 family protein n=1 Tax=Bacillus sp. T33-2 TaxID=2054168 RepID=UPI000C7863D2|nr:DUF3231 family protein [Bacillus sp. T33-2]PLR96780.1 hypothetical protein CVD19_10425 [Bacillus sp. T33-2]
MNTHNAQPKLTSGELAHNWEQYMNNSLSAVVLEYLQATCEAEDIKGVCTAALSTAKSSVDFLETILNNEEYPIPKAFTAVEDLKPNAPKMYSDVFILFYLNDMAKVGMSLTAMALADSARSDIRQFFKERLSRMVDLYESSVSLLLEKGIFVRPPLITSTHQTEPVAEKGFLGNFFNDDRELTAREANELHKNILMNYTGKNLLTGFRQAHADPDLKNLIERGQQIAANIITQLSAILIKNDLPVSMTSDTHVLDSRISPFSDRLIVYHVDQLNRFGVAAYGYSGAVSTRKDLKTTYGKIIAEVYQYEADIKSLMIKKHWMEKPPTALDRDALSYD